MEQQDAARAKRREDREQKEKDSFGTVYAGTTDVRKRKHGDRGVAGEEEERLAAEATKAAEEAAALAEAEAEAAGAAASPVPKAAE